MELESKPNEVPIEYRCPVCGKWGRRFNDPDVKTNLYHCNPKARRGGKGCGEIFRRIKRGACERYLPEWNKYVSGDITREGQITYEVGSRIVGALKRFGLHDPNKRTCNHRDIKSQLLKMLFENDGTKCFCGCGQTETKESINWQLNYVKQYFYSSECRTAFGLALWFICYPGSQITRWYIRNFQGGNGKCQDCGEGHRRSGLELDHTIEVNEGGGMCWLDNFKILCKNCHKKKTALYAAFRANKNKPVVINQPTLFELNPNRSPNK